MKLGPIALKIRIADTSFENRIGGAAELALALSGTLNNEMAFVIPLGESSEFNQYDTGINQLITERIGIVVALYNDSESLDRLGLIAYDRVHDVRAEIFSAILGWNPEHDDLVGSFLNYRGGSLLEIRRDYLWYQFEFERTRRLVNEDGADNGSDALEDFNEIWTDYIVTGKGLPYTGDLPLSNPDMTDLVTKEDDPLGGSFTKEFGTAFDWYQRD